MHYVITCLVTCNTLVALAVFIFPFVALGYPLVVLICPLVVLVSPFVCPLIILVYSLVVLACPLVVLVCPLVVLVVLSVGLFITDHQQHMELLTDPHSFFPKITLSWFISF